LSATSERSILPPQFAAGEFIMGIKPELLEILACPACRAKLELKADGSGLRCATCHRVYPIRDEIPVLIVAEATVEQPPTT
jgi:LSD1 subclass zinc finger protein